MSARRNGGQPDEFEKLARSISTPPHPPEPRLPVPITFRREPNRPAIIAAAVATIAVIALVADLALRRTQAPAPEKYTFSTNETIRAGKVAKQPMRTDNLTGTTEIFDEHDGWHKPRPLPPQPVAQPGNQPIVVFQPPQQQRWKPPVAVAIPNEELAKLNATVDFHRAEGISLHLHNGSTFEVKTVVVRISYPRTKDFSDYVFDSSPLAPLEPLKDRTLSIRPSHFDYSSVWRWEIISGTGYAPR
jgi:hypothetical protein